MELFHLDYVMKWNGMYLPEFPNEKKRKIIWYARLFCFCFDLCFAELNISMWFNDIQDVAMNLRIAITFIGICFSETSDQIFSTFLSFQCCWLRYIKDTETYLNFLVNFQRLLKFSVLIELIYWINNVWDDFFKFSPCWLANKPSN